MPVKNQNWIKKKERGRNSGDLKNHKIAAILGATNSDLSFTYLLTVQMFLSFCLCRRIWFFHFSKLNFRIETFKTIVQKSYKKPKFRDNIKLDCCSISVLVFTESRSIIFCWNIFEIEKTKKIRYFVSIFTVLDDWYKIFFYYLILVQHSPAY